MRTKNVSVFPCFGCFFFHYGLKKRDAWIEGIENKDYISIDRYLKTSEKTILKTATKLFAFQKIYLRNWKAIDDVWIEKSLQDFTINNNLNQHKTKQSLKPFFSIIIPVYNVQAYIARCLDSIVNQTFRDIEIIIVDDCGSDRSIEIAKSYASKDPRIKIIHNPCNLGLFHTRIEGEKQACGKYILHVDSDDFIKLETCEILHQKIQENRSVDGGGGEDMLIYVVLGKMFIQKPIRQNKSLSLHHFPLAMKFGKISQKMAG